MAASATPQHREQPVVARSPLLLAGIAAILLAAGVLRLWTVMAQSAWLDEAYTLDVARLPLSRLVPAVADTDTHPVLYHVTLHFWLKIVGFGVAQGRLLSVICGIGAVLALYLLAGELFDRSTALCAALLLAVSPVAVWYSNEIRMYAMASLFAPAALFFLLRAVGREQWELWACYVVYAALAFYSDYSACYVLAAGAAFSLLLGRRTNGIQSWLVSHTVLLVALLPGLIMLRQQSQHLGSIAWIPPPTLQRVEGTLLDLISLNAPDATSATVIGLGLAGLGLLALVRDWRRPELRYSYVFVISIMLAPLGIALLLSVGHSVFLTRTVLPALTGLLIFFARGIIVLLRPHRPWTLLALGAALVPVLALSGVSLHAAATTTIKEDWRSATLYMAERAHPGDLLLFDPYYGQMPFDVYWSHYDVRTVERGYPHDSELLNVAPQSMRTSEDIARAAAGAHAIWLIIRAGPSILRLSPSIMAWWSRHASFAGSKLFNQVTIAGYALH